MKKAFITGITGQDGSYLTEFLVEKGYEVHGMIRKSSVFNTKRVDHLYKDRQDSEAKMILHYGDLTDSAVINRLIRSIQPDEIYNLGAQSHVKVSFDMPEYTSNVTGLGTVRLLDALIDSGIEAKFYQASSSEMFGNSEKYPQNEETPLIPCSPYACAKVFSHNIIQNYRKAYGIFACSGILFNHESPRRGKTFVTRKITRSVAHILAKKQDHLYLGNLDAKRDWGYAKDYIKAMWMMLQHSEADDYVIATGESHSVRDFLDQAFGLVNLDWNDFVKTDERYLRPSEVHLLQGDYKKAKETLGWEPSVNFEELVRIMLEQDLIKVGLDPDRYLK